MYTYIAFLRGINVSGHHKLPMVELVFEMEKLNFKNVLTILNTGNVIFNSPIGNIETLEKTISEHLENTFGFTVPTIVKKSEEITALLKSNPFRNIEITKDIRLYVSFLCKNIEVDISIPWVSDDNSYQILYYENKTVLSVLDLSITKTTKGMEALEKKFGKNMTTRNWNTIKRIEKKLELNT